MADLHFTPPPCPDDKVFAWSHWIVTFIGQFLARCRAYQCASPVYSVDNDDDGPVMDECFIETDAPHDIKIEAPGLLTKAADALMRFQKELPFSAKTTAKGFAETLRTTRDAIEHDGNFKLDWIIKYRRELEDAVAQLPIPSKKADLSTPDDNAAATGQKLGLNFAFLDSAATREFQLRIDQARRPLEKEHEKRRSELVANVHARNMQNSGLFIKALFLEDFGHAKSLVESNLNEAFSLFEVRNTHLADQHVAEIQEIFTEELRAQGENAIQIALKEGPSCLDAPTAASMTDYFHPKVGQAVQECSDDIELRVIKLRREEKHTQDSGFQSALVNASLSYERFSQTKRALANLIDELLIRFQTEEGHPEFARMFDPATQAAPLAAILGFSKPPVELVVIHRPDSHPLLTNPDFACVLVFRVNEPSALSFAQADIGANAKTAGFKGPPIPIEPPPRATIDHMRLILESWRRSVERLALEDVRLKDPGFPMTVQSPQMAFFALALASELKGTPMGTASAENRVTEAELSQIEQMAKE